MSVSKSFSQFVAYYICNAVHDIEQTEAPSDAITYQIANDGTIVTSDPNAETIAQDRMSAADKLLERLKRFKQSTQTSATETTPETKTNTMSVPSQTTFYSSRIKKYLKRYCTIEGCDFECLDENLDIIITALSHYKKTESRISFKIAKYQAKFCFLTTDDIDKLLGITHYSKNVYYSKYTKYMGNRGGDIFDEMPGGSLLKYNIGKEVFEALPGIFSVSPTKKVRFSSGNLQYNINNHTWRFAPHQYEVIGGKYDIANSQDNYIDLFGWGTGDDPTKNSTDEGDYSYFNDWGNNIDNGRIWRTLSSSEWSYIMGSNSRAKHHYVMAKVNGVNGYVLLPDNWNVDLYPFKNYDDYKERFDCNMVSESEWEKIEKNGAVFLPATNNEGVSGTYHSSSPGCNTHSYPVSFYPYPCGGLYMMRGGAHSHKSAVRLVADDSVSEVVSDKSVRTTTKFTIDELPLDIKNEVIPGIFSVSDTKKVMFSRGNLQYHCKNRIWRFALHPYDVIGKDNGNISDSYDGYIDLFGWGTGDTPTKDSRDERDYNSFVDWGSQVGDGKTWRTLSCDEWKYLLFKRQGFRFVRANYGLILLPDGWDSSIYPFTDYNDPSISGNKIIISGSDMLILKVNGAVYLPTTPYRDGNYAEGYSYGNYWSSSPSGSVGAHNLFFDEFGNQSLIVNSSDRNLGFLVRLVIDVEEIIHTIPPAVLRKLELQSLRIQNEQKNTIFDSQRWHDCNN